MIETAWKKAWPQDQILGIRFHNADWRREVETKYVETDKAFKKTDWSYLGVKVVVKTSGKIATIYPAFISKNDLTGEKTPGVQTKGSGYVIEEMLLAKWKP